MMWYDMIWYNMIWYDMMWYDMIWYDIIWYNMIWTNCCTCERSLTVPVSEVPNSNFSLPGNRLTYFIVSSLILFHHTKNIFHSINFTPTYASFSSSAKLSVSVSVSFPVSVSVSVSLSLSLSSHIITPPLCLLLLLTLRRSGCSGDCMLSSTFTVRYKVRLSRPVAVSS